MATRNSGASALPGGRVTQSHPAKVMEQLEQFNAAQRIAAFEKQQPAMTQ